MSKISLSVQKRGLTRIFADYYFNYLFLICVNLRKSVFLIRSCFEFIVR